MGQLIPLLLSVVVPGLGQCYRRRLAEGISFLCMTLGIWAGIALATIGPEGMRSLLTVAMLAIVYLFVWIPALSDAAKPPQSEASQTLTGDKTWYVVMMLLTVGPGAIPLLWQSHRFSKNAKWAWTAFVLAVFVGGLYLTLVLMPKLEKLLSTFVVL